MELELMFELFVAVCIGAVAFRIRGGLFGDWIRRKLNPTYGATQARLFAWALPMTAVMLLTQPLQVWWFYPMLFLALYVGCLPGWWSSLDLGTREGTFLTDFVLHSVRGLLWVLPAAIVSLFVNAYAMAIALAAVGIACGGLYWLGYQIPSKVPGFSRGPELGELLFGGAIGFALTLL